MKNDKDKDKPVLYHIFKNNPELNVSAIARRLAIPQSVMASYLCGIKKPSPERLREIETSIREIGENLRRIQIVTP
jgi:predicted nucleic acid-binding protein